MEGEIRNVGAAAFITNEYGHVLLVHHTYGHLNWELPGGAGEVNESPAETAVREVKEETGLVVVSNHMTGYYYIPENDTLHFVYSCEVSGVKATPIPDGDEINECVFWPPDALPRPISDWTIQRIQDAIGGSCFELPLIIGRRVWVE